MSSTPALMFAAYLRTSTDDQQSPEDSKRWQLDIANRLIAPAGGTIVATYHDVDVTRELPWARRGEASRLLSDAANPFRGWTALVVAEPQRAFSGGQFSLFSRSSPTTGSSCGYPSLVAGSTPKAKATRC